MKREEVMKNVIIKNGLKGGFARISAEIDLSLSTPKSGKYTSAFLITDSARDKISHTDTTVTFAVVQDRLYFVRAVNGYKYKATKTKRNKVSISNVRLREFTERIKGYHALAYDPECDMYYISEDTKIA